VSPEYSHQAKITIKTIMLPGYVILTQLVKTWFSRGFGN